MSQGITPAAAAQGMKVHIVNHIPGQQSTMTITLDCGAVAHDAVRLCCPERWQEHVFVISQGKILLRQDPLWQDATLEIYPIVDGG